MWARRGSAASPAACRSTCEADPDAGWSRWRQQRCGGDDPCAGRLWRSAPNCAPIGRRLGAESHFFSRAERCSDWSAATSCSRCSNRCRMGCPRAAVVRRQHGEAFGWLDQARATRPLPGRPDEFCQRSQAPSRRAIRKLMPWSVRNVPGRRMRRCRAAGRRCSASSSGAASGGCAAAARRHSACVDASTDDLQRLAASEPIG